MPVDPAEAISLAHDETLYLKKINSVFTSVTKIYGDFLTLPSNFLDTIFLYVHIPLPTMFCPSFTRQSSNPDYSGKNSRYSEDGAPRRAFVLSHCSICFYPKPLS